MAPEKHTLVVLNPTALQPPRDRQLTPEAKLWMSLAEAGTIDLPNPDEAHEIRLELVARLAAKHLCRVYLLGNYEDPHLADLDLDSVSLGGSVRGGFSGEMHLPAGVPQTVDERLALLDAFLRPRKDRADPAIDRRHRRIIWADPELTTEDFPDGIRPLTYHQLEPHSREIYQLASSPIFGVTEAECWQMASWMGFDSPPVRPRPVWKRDGDTEEQPF